MKKIILVAVGLFLATNVYGLELIGPVEEHKVREYVRREIGYINDQGGEYGSIGPFEENKIREIIRHKLGYINSLTIQEFGWIGPIEERKIESIIMNELRYYGLPKNIEQLTKENTLLKDENTNLEKRVEGLLSLLQRQMSIIETFKNLLSRFI